MDAETLDARWKWLAELLAPIHGQAMASARRLSRSAADGDDLYQETVLRAFDKLHTLRDPSRFKSWFYATLLSRHRGRYRRMFWRRLVPLDEAFPPGREPVGEDGAAWDEVAERAKRVTLALSTLALEQREAVVLFELDGFSIDEIAATQDASVPAVKSRLVRGRDRLRRFYQRHGWLDARGRDGNAPSGSVSQTSGPSVSSARHDSFAPLGTTPAFGLVGKERTHE